MVYYVENKDIAKRFMDEYTSKDSVIFPLFKNRTEHPIANKLLGVFVFIGEHCWVIMEDHNDCVPVSLSILERGERVKYIFDTKWFLHQTKITNWKSVDVSYHLMEFKSYAYDMIYQSFTNGYRDKSDISFIPIATILKGVVDFVVENAKYARIDSNGFDRYNDYTIPSFLRIEANGIPTTYGYEYSLYNNFTTTGRPSNTFGGVNYSALKKSDGSRDFIVSKNGELVQYDFDGYHIRLIAKLIGEPMPEGSAHEWLGRQYFGKDELTEEDYLNSKKITFQQLYGGIDVHNLEIPFFQKTNDFITKLYKNFVVNGFIETRFGKRIPFTKIDNHNAQKVFNYYLQALETEQNVLLLHQLNSLLENTKTKLVLYTYDSFLFDVDTNEIELLSKIEEVLHRISPTKMEKNYTYGNI